MLNVGSFFALLFILCSGCTIALVYIDHGNFDKCVKYKWIPSSPFVFDALYYITLIWVCALQCIPKCFPARRSREEPLLAEGGQEMQHVSHLGVPEVDYRPSTSSCSSVDNGRDLASSPDTVCLASLPESAASDAGLLQEMSFASESVQQVDGRSFDWNSCWLLLFCFLYYLGYDASIKASLVFGIDDAYRSESIALTCGIDDEQAPLHSPVLRGAFYKVSTEAIYKVSPTIVRAWMLFFMVLFVAVRRKRDPWLLSSYCGGQSTTRHGAVERVVMFFLFLQCIQFTLQVYLNGLATQKQIACSFITLSIACLVFFFTLHVLQADLHPLRSSLRPKIATLPGNYMWCTFSLFVYWSCGFLFYLNSGSGNFDKSYSFEFSMGISMAILYCCIHAAAWIIFFLVSWCSKAKVIASVGQSL